MKKFKSYNHIQDDQKKLLSSDSSPMKINTNKNKFSDEILLDEKCIFDQSCNHNIIDKRNMNNKNQLNNDEILSKEQVINLIEKYNQGHLKNAFLNLLDLNTKKFITKSKFESLLTILNIQKDDASTKSKSIHEPIKDEKGFEKVHKRKYNYFNKRESKIRKIGLQNNQHEEGKVYTQNNSPSNLDEINPEIKNSSFSIGGLILNNELKQYNHSQENQINLLGSDFNCKSKAKLSSKCESTNNT